MRRYSKIRSAPNLRRMFAVFNRRWWGGKLPGRRVRLVWAAIPKRKAVAYTRFYADGGMTIFMSTVIKDWPSIWKGTLLHEMAHVATEDEPAQHGKQWRAEILRLRKAGAFDPYL